MAQMNQMTHLGFSVFMFKQVILWQKSDLGIIVSDLISSISNFSYMQQTTSTSQGEKRTVKKYCLKGEHIVT